MHAPCFRSSDGRRPLLRLAATAALLGLVAPLTLARPASADPAPLVTQDAVGIRVDEAAFAGPVLAQIETSLQPFVDQMIREGAMDSAPVDSYYQLDVSSDVELSLDFLPPSAARPSGGLAIHATIASIDIRYAVDPSWPFSDCSIWVRPDTATIDASARVDRSRLPATPLALDPISATWDDDPSVSTSGVCWSYLIDDAVSGWWDDVVGNDPESTASKIEAKLNSQAQTLLDDLWGDHVAPVLDSLGGFGVTVDQLRTDDHGLIVTADLDASNLSFPGLGPLDVSGAVDAGVSTDVDALLTNRSTTAGASDAIVSIHPNVANQFLAGLNNFTGGFLASDYLPASIETTLLPPAARATYRDNGWYYELHAAGAPYTSPTGAGGAPVVTFPASLVVYHEDQPEPMATFTGSISGVGLVTTVRSGSTDWGPNLSTTGLTASLTRTQAHADVVAANPSGAAMVPTAKASMDKFNSDVFLTFVHLAPISIGGLSVNLCTTCGRYAGDQRYTETFHIG